MRSAVRTRNGVVLQRRSPLGDGDGPGDPARVTTKLRLPPTNLRWEAMTRHGAGRTPSQSCRNSVKRLEAVPQLMLRTSM